MTKTATCQQMGKADAAGSRTAAHPAAAAQPARGPQPLDARFLSMVSGGSPKGGWQSAELLSTAGSPKGGW